MFLLTLIIGFIAAVIAAAPPGAANLAVINTTLNHSIYKSRLLIIGAGLGEIAIAIATLYYTKIFVGFFKENLWIQITVFSLFIIIGMGILLKKQIPTKNLNLKFNIKIHTFLRGFLFAFINPPVILFWVLAYTVIRMYGIHISEMSMVSTLLLFFLGIFLGKTATLYAYAIWSEKLNRKSTNSKSRISTITGIALVVIGVLQAIKFSYF
ncbi:LysE family transporter [Patiriisocius marinus]|uniref:Threonine/homoserine/homoserine lactone efflux protein n=1 Tax=Patiriisocius marinus TaxID=1397112 RepID=A0A5J4J4L7_9FLAO|nr:LysE family transporter [Patiriisocius marinus]GER60978.1 hypothetical protein ULMA_30860 [Patiriisocius marinus]